MGIEIRNVSKTFGGVFAALHDVNLQIYSGEMLALLGPSGSGKTTLLRIIAGLEIPDAGGEIIFDGAEAQHQEHAERHVGFVFQHYALFRHMSVFENVAFGLRVRPKKVRPSKQEINDRVFRLLQLVQLEELANRMPSELSGGQRQRVALARALAVEPRVLLLDEPFGALDARVRQELRRWLRHLQEQIHLTCILVTHDQEEAMEVSDRVVVMHDGRVEQVGTPEEVYHIPKSEFVLNFLGNVNLFHGRVEAGQAHIGPGKIENAEIDESVAGEAKVFIRPHDLEIHQFEPQGKSSFPAKVRHINAAGSVVKVELMGEDGANFFAEITHDVNRELNLADGDHVFVHVKDVRVFLQEKGEAE